MSWLGALVAVLVATTTAAAQPSSAPDEQQAGSAVTAQGAPVAQPGAAGPHTKTRPAEWPDIGAAGVDGLDEAAPSTRFCLATVWPEVGGPTLAWFAAVVILVLGLRSRPFLSLANLDALVLAAMCVLLALRSAGGVGDAARVRPEQWWAHVLLSVAAGYWLLRGVRLLMARTVPSRDCRVSNAGLLILLIVGLAVGFTHILRAPLSAGARDGLIGGIHTATTGRLPYGDTTGHDARSPLLYLLYAGTAKLTDPSVTLHGRPVEESWNTVGKWLANGEDIELFTVPHVGGFLFVTTLVGLLLIGRRLHSPTLGLAVGVVYCVFPGVVECLPRPEIMLPALLLTWTIAFALLAGVGGLLSTFCLVLAGFAWPWAWLGLPPLVAYFLRRSWQGFGGVVGLVGAAAACVAGLIWLTAPSLPRAAGALSAAGLAPEFTARLSPDDGALILDRPSPDPVPKTDFKSGLWRFLLERENQTLPAASARSTAPRIVLPNAVDGAKVRYRLIDTADEARTVLQREYRAALGATPTTTRIWVALRTVLEATWLPAVAPERPIKGSWELWAGPAAPAPRWAVIRRLVKVVTGLLGVGLAAAVFFGRRNRPHQLVGALTAVCSAALFASAGGAAANLAWLMPVILVALTARAESPRPAPAAASTPAPPPPPYGGPAPRITVED